MPAGPRINSAHAFNYMRQNVTVIGEVTSINTGANSLTLSMPDGETLIVLLGKDNATTIEPRRLTEVTGVLISRGQIEANWVKQYGESAMLSFNRSLYVDAINLLSAHRRHYDIGSA